MKLKEETQMTEHLNVFQSMENKLDAMKMIMNDEMQTSLLLCSLSDYWGTFVVTINKIVLNDALSIEFMKGNLYSKETRRKAYDKENV